MEMMEEESRIHEHVGFANRLAAWLREAGVEDTGLAVDFVDIVQAARRVEELLARLVTLSSENPPHDEILATLGMLHAWLFVEIKAHLAELEAAWPALESRFESPDE